jgi:hypothetical protein
LLERAVRWVIILLIFVFDPLALMLVIAAISSYKWEFEVKEEKLEPQFAVTGPGYLPLDETEKETLTDTIQPKPQIVPRVMGQPVMNHKADVFEAALGLGQTVEIEENKPEASGLKKRLTNAQNKLKNLLSQAKEFKLNQAASSLKEKLSWKNLSNWNNSPVLKLFNNLKNKLQK